MSHDEVSNNLLRYVNEESHLVVKSIEDFMRPRWVPFV